MFQIKTNNFEEATMFKTLFFPFPLFRPGYTPGRKSGNGQILKTFHCIIQCFFPRIRCYHCELNACFSNAGRLTKWRICAANECRFFSSRFFLVKFYERGSIFFKCVSYFYKKVYLNNIKNTICAYNLSQTTFLVLNIHINRQAWSIVALNPTIS